MAERRMFTKKVTDDDNFMALSSSAQALYLHLSMCADDDGFCNQVSISMFKAHASVQDLQALLEKRYIYQFENGVIVIKHWRMANALRKDRYTPTAFQEELKQLSIKTNGSYTRLPSGCQMVADCLPQDSIGKDSIGKESLEEEKDTIPYASIIDYLNTKAGTNYRASSAKTKTAIHARFEEGFVEEDFRIVIDKKCAEWIGTEWEKFLRPETLFGTKFESYLNANVVKKNAQRKFYGRTAEEKNAGYCFNPNEDDLSDLF
jgi:uncharacterized phage protein (TIGR02220 family)